MSHVEIRKNLNWDYIYPRDITGDRLDDILVVLWLGFTGRVIWDQLMPGEITFKRALVTLTVTADGNSGAYSGLGVQILRLDSGTDLAASAHHQQIETGYFLRIVGHSSCGC